MELKDYARVVWRYLWLIGVLVIVVGGPLGLIVYAAYSWWRGVLPGEISDGEPRL